MVAHTHGSPTTHLEQAILERLRPGIHQRLRLLEAEQIGQIDPAWVADAMLNALPTQHPFSELGPFYDTSGVIGWLGITRQALHQKAKSRQILTCTTGDGQRVYPAWQFRSDGRALAGLPQVLQALLEATDPWTAAIWLTTPTDRLGEMSAVDWLTTRRDPDPVIEAAREDAARWAQ